MSLNRVLNIGSNGLIGAALGTSVSSQNITNSATEGYSRQRAHQTPRPIHYGGGINIDVPTRVRDAFVERRLLIGTSLDGEGRARSESLETLDMLFEDSAGNVGDAMGNFESAMAVLVNEPDSQAARDMFLSRSTQLTQAFNQAGQDLEAARSDANSRIGLSLDVVNGKLQTIADLGREIAASGTVGADVATLMDQRDQLVREVAEHLPVSVIEQPGGSITLLLAGSRSLVPADGPVAKLMSGIDANGDATVLRVGTGSAEDVTSLVTSGSIAGYLDARDGGITNAQASLDQLAFDITSAYNTTHQAGFGQDGVAGRNLFEPLAAATGAAALFAVSADVAGQPANLGVGAAGVDPGDNGNAVAMLDLAQTDIALGNTTTAAAAYGVLIAQVGTAVQGAGAQADRASGALEQARALRESISGVSTDEEMVSLMRFQRAYQASLRVIETADAMLAELLSMRR